MSNAKDFVIKNGVLEEYHGSGGDVVIPDGVKEFGNFPVFCDFWEPFRLTLADGMTASFDNLLSQGIVSLNVPAGVKFTCSACGPNHSSFYALLEEINVDPGNPHCSSENGILFDKEKTVLYACPAAHKGAVVIPETVKVIAPHAFDGCKLLKEIVIPASVTEIGERAFMDCKALARVVLTSDKTKIGAEAFLRCAKLTSAGPKGTLPGKGNGFEFPWTKEIPENAFSGMNKLKKVVLPETIAAIGKNAFKGCKSLEEINLPENVKCDKKTFKDCKSLSV